MQFSGATTLARVRRVVATLTLGAAFVLAAQVSPAAAAPVLVGQWNFDEADGQVVQDSGPFGLDGLLGSSPAVDAEDPLRIAGASGGALQVGDGAFVSVADRRRLDLKTLTVETVANAPSSPGTYRYLVVHGSRDCFAGAYGLYTAENGGLAFYVFDGERFFVSASAAPEIVWDGQWHRVTGSFDGRLVRVFVDGREVGAPLATPEGTAVEYASMPEGTYFGNYIGACRLPFAGALDSVRIFTEAIPPATIAANAGVPVVPGTAAATPLPAAAAPTIIKGTPPKSSCKVTVSRKSIRSNRKTRITVRATADGRPLSRTRLAIRRASALKMIARPLTDGKGVAKVSLRVAKKGGRLRVGVLGRSSCTPAFISITSR